MINTLIENYKKTIEDIEDNIFTIDVKSLLYAKIVQMQLINITGSKGTKTKSIMEYIRILEREEDSNFEKYYKDLMFLDTVLDRDINISKNYDITIELSGKISSRLDKVIDFLSKKNLPNKSGDVRLSLSQIRELNKKADKGSEIINPFDVEEVPVQDKDKEATVIVDVEHKEEILEEPIVEVKEPKIDLDSYIQKIVDLIDSKVQESISQLEKTVTSSDTIIKQSVSEVNSDIKNTINSAIKEANDSISNTVNDSIMNISKIIEDKKEELSKLTIDKSKVVEEPKTSTAYDLGSINIEGVSQDSPDSFTDEPVPSLGSSELFGEMNPTDSVFNVYNDSLIESDED